MFYIALWLTLATVWLGTWIWAWTMEARDKKALQAQQAPTTPKEEAKQTAPAARPVAAAAH